MNPQVKLSCYPDHFVATLEINDQIFEGSDDCLSGALSDLADEVALAEEYFDVVLEGKQ